MIFAERIDKIYNEVGFVVGGHRGDLTNYPENTMASYKAAVEAGADMLEIDVQLSSDGIPVLLHDVLLDRTTNGSGPANRLSLKELKALDAGSWFSDKFKGEQIPTVEELFKWAQDYPELLLDVEIKEKDSGFKCADEIVKLIDKYDLRDKVVFNALDAQILEYCHDKHGFPLQCVYAGRYLSAAQNYRTGTDGTFSKAYCGMLHANDLCNEYVQLAFNQGKEAWITLPAGKEEEIIAKASRLGIKVAVCNAPGAAISAARKLKLRK